MSLNVAEAVKSFAHHFLVQSSLLCKSLYGVAIAGFLLQLIFGSVIVDILCISVQSLGTHLWTLLTFWLVETNVLVLVGDLMCIHLAGTMLEPVWKTAELVKYMLLVNAVVSLSATLSLFVAYFTGLATEQSFFEMPVHGLSGLNGAVLVAVKQMLPDSVILATQFGRLKNNHIPSLIFLITVLLVIFQLMKWIVPAMYVAGAYYGWVYLRYYQKHDSGSKGDPAEHFALVTFFPAFSHAYLAPVFNFIYRILVRLRVIKPHIRRFLDVNQMTSSVNMVLPGAETQEAERRRQKALRELSERLARTRQQCDADIERSSWPVLDEPDSNNSTTSKAPSIGAHGHSHGGSHGHSHGDSHGDSHGHSHSPQMSPLPVDINVAAATAAKLVNEEPRKTLKSDGQHRPSSLLSSNEQLNYTPDDNAQLVLSAQSPTGDE